MSYEETCFYSVPIGVPNVEEIATALLQLKDNPALFDLTTAQIIIEDGAYFKGSIEIERSAEKEDDKNVLSRTASAPAMPTRGAGPKSI
jgi:hypothetical protein